jgi:hypothetical protein
MSMEQTMVGVSKEALQHDAQSWASRAKGLRIVDVETYTNASHLLRSVKGVRAEIAGWFAPHIDGAMETKRRAESARKALVDEKDRMEAGLVEAETVLKRGLLEWESTQERRRREQEAALQAEAQRQAEAATLAVAASLELEAHATGDADMLQEAQDILDQPVLAPVVSVKTTLPKVQGIVYRDQWKAHPEIDVKALAGAVASGQVPVTFLTPNLSALNNYARATEGGATVPGVKFWNDRQIAARG